MQTDRIQASNIFIWGDIGEDIKKKDEKRMLSVAHQDPDYNLSLIANQEIKVIMKALKDNKGKLDDKTTKLILKSNELDNEFREISKFFKYNPDMLSIGSFITGHKSKQGGVADILTE